MVMISIPLKQPGSKTSLPLSGAVTILHRRYQSYTAMLYLSNIIINKFGHLQLVAYRLKYFERIIQSMSDWILCALVEYTC